MKLSDGKWSPIIKDGVKDNTPFRFHILCKRFFHDMFNTQDPLNADITVLKDMPFEDRWAELEKGEFPVRNEMFLRAFLGEYIKTYKKFQPSPNEEMLVPKLCNMVITTYRNDSAYFERGGGIIKYIINNIDKFEKCRNLDYDCSEILKNIKTWWKINDKRLRTKPWISWMFDYSINKCKKDLFYRRSFNMFFIFCMNNASKWDDDPVYNPDKWFPRERGKLVNALYNWMF